MKTNTAFLAVCICLLNDTMAQNVGIGTTTPTAKLDVNGSIKIQGLNLFEFGAGIEGKEVNAGKIGYNAFGQNALTFLGAGTSASNRAFYFYGEGGTTFNGPVKIMGYANITGPIQMNGNAGTAGQVLQSTGVSNAPAWVNPSQFQYNNTYINYLATGKTALATGGQVNIFARTIILVRPAIVMVTSMAVYSGSPAIGKMSTSIFLSGAAAGSLSTVYFQSSDVGYGTISDKYVLALPAGTYNISVDVGSMVGSTNIILLSSGISFGTTVHASRMITEVIYQ